MNVTPAIVVGVTCHQSRFRMRLTGLGAEVFGRANHIVDQSRGAIDCTSPAHGTVMRILAKNGKNKGFFLQTRIVNQLDELRISFTTGWRKVRSGI